MKTKKGIVGERLGSAKSKLSNLLKSSYVKTILLAVIVVGSVIAFWFGLRVGLGTEHPLLTVASGSMVPTLNVGDLIVVQGVLDFSALKAAPQPEGDVIVFHRPPGGSEDDLIVHRAVSKEQDSDGSWYFRTQGDHNSGQDPWRVPESLVVGKVVASVPWLGYLPLYMRTPYGMLLIILLIGLILLAEFLPVLSKKQTKKEG